MTLQDSDLLAEGLSSTSSVAGYDVEAPGMIRGVSGVEHTVDLLCRGNRGTVLVDIRKDGDSVGVIPVLSLYAKVIDTKCSRATLVAVPEAGPLARELSEQYRLLLCEARTIPQAISHIEKKVLTSPPKNIASVNHGAVSSCTTEGVPYHVGSETTYARRIKLRVIKSSLKLLILRTASQTDVTGYDVISIVHSMFGTLLSPGTVYPILKLLEKEGMIKPAETAHKRTYSTTPFGKLVSNVCLAEWEQINRELLQHLQNFGGNAKGTRT